MSTDTEKPHILTLLPDLLAFGFGLALAYYLKWETKDLVWSLWLCSLVLGYLTILSIIFGGAYLGIAALRNSDFKKEKRLPALLIGTGAGLFFLAFFSVHFCGFHAGHSVFLRGFFPLEGVPNDGFGEAFTNPPLLWYLVFKHLMKPYGLFLIPAIIAERNHIFLPVIKAYNAIKDAHRPALDLLKPEGAKSPAQELMARPYKNVIRMHLLIFFFAFCHFLKVDSFLVYTVVYFVYFFPFGAVRSLFLSGQKIVDERP